MPHHLTALAKEVATAIIALFNGFAIECLADPDAASGDRLAHTIAGIVQSLSNAQA